MGISCAVLQAARKTRFLCTVPSERVRIARNACRTYPVMEQEQDMVRSAPITLTLDAPRTEVRAEVMGWCNLCVMSVHAS